MGRKSRAKRQRRQQAERYEHRYQVFAPAKYPAQPRPSDGLNESERDLARLARETFMSFWSYPNVVRDEMLPNGGAIAKEVADLLVVFENDVILFSDKDCVFPNTGNLDLDWSRWYRRAIERSAAQLWGAERWIRQHPERLFIDQRCSIRLPVPMPDSSQMRVHRIVVAHGACDACRKNLGGSGSLMIMPHIVGSEHCRPRNERGVPFAVGRVDASKPFVHVLDDTSLRLLLSHLDTVSDFVAYLRKKQAFIEADHLLSAAGEEALLGYYFAKLNAEGEHDLIPPPSKDGGIVKMVLDVDWWLGYQDGPEFRRKADADEVSYFWDHHIEKFTKNFLQGTSQYLSDTTPETHDRIVRFFARENRTRRRMLASSLIEMLKTTPADKTRTRVLLPSRPGDPHWVLVLFPQFPDKPHEQYRTVRRSYLEACCQVVKLQHPDALDIIGFATESGRRGPGSEDAAYYDARDWNEGYANEARRLQRDLRILLNPRMIKHTEYEYPRPPTFQPDPHGPFGPLGRL